MTSKGFSVGEVLKLGWNIMKEHLWFFVSALIIGMIISTGGWVGSQWSYNTDQHGSLIALLWVIAFVLSALIHLGFINISLRYVDKKNVNLGHLFSIFPQILKYIAANILYSLVIIIGLALFIIPGIYWGVKYSLFPYFIIDKEVGPIEALKLSGEATEGAKWDLFAFGIVSMLIAWLGVICLVIGLFAALPTIWIASAAIYRRLTKVS